MPGIVLGPDSDITISYSTCEAKRCWFISWWVTLFCVLGTEEIPMKQCGSCSHTAHILVWDYNCWKSPCVSGILHFLQTFSLGQALRGELRSWADGQVLVASRSSGLDATSPESRGAQLRNVRYISRAQGSLLVRIFLPWSLASSQIPCRGPTRGLLHRAYLPEL